jgi:nitroreductase
MSTRPERPASDHDAAFDLASVDLVLRTTRSVRRRIDFERTVEPEVIETCIDLATQAPTGAGMEAWRFVVVRAPAKKAAIADLYRASLARFEAARGAASKPAQRALADRLQDMPALILVCAEGRPLSESPALQVGFYGSILPAAWSLMLAQRARGLGSPRTSLHLLHEDEMARLLGIPDSVSQTVLLPVGYTKDAVLKPAERRPAAEITYWDAWGRARE